MKLIWSALGTKYIHETVFAWTHTNTYLNSLEGETTFEEFYLGRIWILISIYIYAILLLSITDLVSAFDIIPLPL